MIVLAKGGYLMYFRIDLGRVKVLSVRIFKDCLVQTLSFNELSSYLKWD